MHADVTTYLHRKASMRGIPLMGGFELSPVCNFQCKMCFVRKTPAQIKRDGQCVKDWQQWLALAKQCKDAGTLFLLLTGGEPFIYPHFKELYLALHKMGFILYINTNGTMITQETVDWLKEAAPGRVNITLYGASPDTYARVCRDASGFARAANAIDMLKAAGIAVLINVSMIPENHQDLADIIAFGKERDIEVRIASYMFPPVRRECDTDDSRFSPEEAASFYLNKFKLTESEEGFRKFCDFVLNDPQEEESAGWGQDEEHMLCRAGRSTFWVSWDGQMSACGMMPLPAQYPIFEKPFLECWQDLVGKVKNMYVLSQCGGCKLRHVCRPCAAALYAETGDPNCKAPYMCRTAECIRELFVQEAEKNR